MPSIDLLVDQLLLDTNNPRIRDAHKQRDALQKVIEDQGDKLAVLAESIARNGLNPVDRLLVVADSKNNYVVLEGNRRAAALKILSNPAVLTSLDIDDALQRRLERAAENFGSPLGFVGGSRAQSDRLEMDA